MAHDADFQKKLDAIDPDIATMDVRDHRCAGIGCNETSFNHANNESWRRCCACAKFVFGGCHGMPKDKKFNVLQNFKCPACTESEAFRASGSLLAGEATRSMLESVALPEGYTKEDPTTHNLGAPAQSDLDTLIGPEIDTPGFAGNAKRHANPPCAAIIKGCEFAAIEIGEVDAELNNMQHPLTTQTHIKIIKGLITHIKNSPDWSDLSLSRIVIRYLLLCNKAREWSPQTLHRMACATVGALWSLPIYTKTKLGICISIDPFWKRVITHWKTKAAQNQPFNQAAATPQELLAAIGRSTDDDTTFALALMWSTGARFSDIINLRRKSISVWNPDDGKLKVIIDYGKVMRHVQPYTVDAVVTKPLRKHFVSFLEGKTEEEEFLFPLKEVRRDIRLSRINNALKAIRFELSTRAIRRGALQAMAIKGVDLPDLMLYSGHRSEQTCLRYLDFGALALTREKRAQAAAKHLEMVEEEEEEEEELDLLPELSI